MKVKTRQYLAIFLLLLQFLQTPLGKDNPNGLTLDRLEIFSVSTRIKEIDYEAKGSILGGTRLFIKAKGHSITASDNTIRVGPYPCKIPEKGISGDIIHCFTSPAIDPNQRLNLQVEIITVGKAPSICSAKKGCTFNYERQTTPMLDFIEPSVQVPNGKVNWKAIWRVETTKDIKKLKIGEYNCNRFELQPAKDRKNPTNLNDDDKISKNNNVKISCQISETQEAGLYTVSSETVFGDPYKLSQTKMLTADGQNTYELVIQPEIKSIDQNTGGNQGNRLVIEGLGFGTNPDNAQVNVGALQCNIVEIENDKIICDLAAGLTDAENADQFQQGQGVQVTKYRLSERKGDAPLTDSGVWSASALYTKISDDTLGSDRIVDDHIQGNWEGSFESHTDEGRQGIHARGYFKAPRTGDYVFWLAADDTADVYLNQVPLNTTIDADNKILSKCAHTHERYYLYPNECGSNSEAITLQEGEFYWLELYAVNTWWSGSYALSVQTPTPAGGGDKWINALNQVSEFKITPTKDNQRWSFKMFNTDEDFQFSLKYTDPKTRKKTLDEETGSKAWDSWNEDTFVRAINTLSQNHGAELFQKNDLDENGDVCAGCTAAGVEYIIDFTLYRTDGKLNQTPECNLGQNFCKVEKIQDQSDPVEGTFGLQISFEDKNGNSVQEQIKIWSGSEQDWISDLPYSTRAWQIYDGLCNIDERFMDTQYWDYGRSHDGYRYNFNWRSNEFKDNVPTFTINASGLQGGKGGTRPSVPQTVKVQPSSNPVYEPIPFDMSFTKASKPHVHLEVNDVQARCTGNCEYVSTDDQTITLTSFSVSSNTVTLDLSTNAGLTVDILQVWYGGSKCEISNSDLSALTCDVEAIEAGDHKAIVLAQGYGFAECAQAADEVLPVVSSLDTTTGSTQGGKEIVITGTGFPISDLEGLQVKFGTAIATVISASNTEIKVEVPTAPTGEQDEQVIVVYGGKESVDVVNYTYDNTGLPTIASVVIGSEPQVDLGTRIKASPVLKQKMTITGTNFGSQVEKLRVLLLKDGEKVYRLNINEITDPQTLVVTLGGGRTGQYKLRVLNIDIGYSTEDFDFDYEIGIDSISPTSGNRHGGATITITGYNFGEDINSNQIFVEQMVSHELIKAQAFTVTPGKTSLEVRLPPMPEGGDIGSPFTITVFGRLIEQAECNGSCDFTYTDGTDAPKITTPSDLQFKNAQTVSLRGQNLPLNGASDTVKLFIGSKEVTLDFDTANQLQDFDIPEDIAPGKHLFKIDLASYGIIGQFEGEILYVIDSYTPTGQSSLGGNEVTIIGSGFNQYSEVYIGDHPCIIRSLKGSEIKCSSQPHEEAGARDILIKELPYDDIECNNCMKYQASGTATILTSTPDSSSNEIALDGSDFVYTIDTSEKISQTHVVEIYLQAVANPKTTIQATMTNNGGVHTATFAAAELQAGKFDVRAHVSPDRGFAIFETDAASQIIFTIEEFDISDNQTGLSGGSTLTVTGKGINTIQPDTNKINICGHPCLVKQDTVTSTEIQCVLPQVNTEYLLDNDFSIQQFDRKNQRILLQKNEPYSAFSQVLSSETTDKNILSQITHYPITMLEDSTNECWIQFDVTANAKVFLEKLVLDPGAKFDNTQFYKKLKLQGSDDASTWTDLDTFSPAHVSDYQEIVLNSIKGVPTGKDEKLTQIKQIQYKHYRILETQAAEDKASCQFTIKKIVGDIFYDQTVSTDSDFNCPVEVIVNGELATITSSKTVAYQGTASTPKLQEISPKYFHPTTPEQITLKGVNFGTTDADITIKIYGQDCTVDSCADDQVVCTPAVFSPVENSKPLEVYLNGVQALISNNVEFFPGALKWSDPDAWGGEAPPRNGDNVYIPKGQTLVVDESTNGILQTVIVEGTLFFDPSVTEDITFEAKYIIIRKGQFLIGSERNRYENNKLTITMYGTYDDPQLPSFGNKVIGCHNCRIEMHGALKRPHMALLKSTVEAGVSEITVDQSVDWLVDDEIVIATTDYDGKHSEKVKITSVDNSGGDAVIQFTPKLKHCHIAETETYGGTDIVMKAEVINISSNVVIQGNPKDSLRDQYGAHVMIHGKEYDGTLAKFDSIEFRYTGQPRILGRYTVHYHMVGDAPSSYVKNIKVHDSNARVVALHATNYLTVQRNVGYNVQAHNIFLEDGIETNNIIEYNCIISPKSAFNMLQTDITVAGIWITNPANYVRFNHVAGSQFYGLWYELKEEPETRADVCPTGMPILEVANNVAHSNIRYGLRFFNLQSREMPCKNVKNPLSGDIFDSNPSIQYIYKNHTLYKNGESGLLAEFVGDSIFEDVYLADNFRAGFQAHVSNFTAEPVVIRDSLIVGRTTSNGEDIDFETCAILVPRSSGFMAKDIKIHNFGNGTNIIESSSENQFKLLWPQGGYQSQVEGLSIVDSDDAGRVKYQGPRTNMIYDKDGSLSGTNQETYIAPYNGHFNLLIDDGVCTRDTDKYDDSVICQTTIRAVKFGNLEELDLFVAQRMRIANLNLLNVTYDIEDLNQTDFGDSYSVKIMSKDGDNDYVALLPVDYTYQIHWNQGMDWDHLLVYPSYETKEDDKTIVLKFPYTKDREVFDVYRMVGGENGDLFDELDSLDKFIDSTTLKPNNNPDGCSNGDWFQDKENKFFYLCINGKNRNNITYQQIDVNAIYCRDSCSNTGFACEGEKKNVKFLDDSTKQAQYVDVGTAKAVRKLPNETEWSLGIPQSGDDFIIPCDWIMTFNLDEFQFGTLYIDGVLKIDETKSDVLLKANNIWIRGGKLVVGGVEQAKIYKNNFEIQLTGTQDSPNLFIDDLSKTGTKSLAVTGQLELYGKVPEVTHTRLAVIANTNDTTIQVVDEIDGWNVGDELVLAGNQFDGLGFEKVVIQSKDDATKTITLENPLEYWHYGNANPTVSTSEDAETTIDEKYGGELDLRTSVGHITRNIKITGSDEDSLGGHLQIYHYIFSDEDEDIDINTRGTIQLQGVELSNMGQRDSQNGGLHFSFTDQDGLEEAQPSSVKGCSMHDCNGFCVNAHQAKLFEIHNTVFYNGVKFIIQALETSEVTITENLMIGVIKRPAADIGDTKQWDPVAHIHMYTGYLPSEQKHNVSKNVAWSSEGIGYAFPGTPCEEKADVGFTQNQVGYCAYTGILFNLDEDKCYHVGHNSVHNCVDGITLNSGRTKDGYDAEKMIIAECKINIKLHTGSTHIIHNNYLRDTFISAQVRQTCTECYTQDLIANKNTRCSDLSGIQLHVTTTVGEKFPWVKNPFVYDVICAAPSAFGSCFIQDVELHNFREQYPEEDYPNSQLCGNNKAFRNHRSAADATAGTYLTDVKCTDCDKNGFIYLMEPKDAWAGWFGGCGAMDCTGLENMLVQDLTGDLLGHEGTIISNNEDMGTAQYIIDNCEFVPAWNAYDCQTTDFGVLEWEATSVDKQKKSPVPIELENSQFSHKINMWREWSWQGPEPLNERLNRFVALVKMNEWTIISYSGTQCTEHIHKLQQRESPGEQDRHIIVQYSYPSPLAIEVEVDGSFINPFPVKSETDLADHSTTCGANIYHSKNNTIQFVVTNIESCQVLVSQRNSVKLSMRISMTADEFYSDSALQTDFMSRIALFLGIDMSRIRIVGVSSSRRRNLEEGGAQLEIIILADKPGDPKDGYDPKATYLELRELAQNVEQGITQASLDLGDIQVTEISYDLAVMKDPTNPDTGGVFDDDDLNPPVTPGNPGTRQQDLKPAPVKADDDDDNDGLEIALAITFGILGAIGIVLVSIYVYNNKVKKQQENQGATRTVVPLDDNPQEEDYIKSAMNIQSPKQQSIQDENKNFQFQEKIKDHDQDAQYEKQKEILSGVHKKQSVVLPPLEQQQIVSNNKQLRQHSHPSTRDNQEEVSKQQIDEQEALKNDVQKNKKMSMKQMNTLYI